MVRGFALAGDGDIAIELTVADNGEARLTAYFRLPSTLEGRLEGTREAQAFFSSLEDAHLALQDDCVQWLWPDEL